MFFSFFFILAIVLSIMQESGTRLLVRSSLFSNLQLEWVTTTDSLLGLASFLPPNDGGIPISPLPKDKTSEQGFLHHLFCANCQAGKL